jgi:hypothetical protein
MKFELLSKWKVVPSEIMYRHIKFGNFLSSRIALL